MTKQDEIAAEKVRQFEAAFLQSIANIKDDAKVAELEKLISDGDVDGVFRLLGLDDSAFNSVKDEIRSSFEEGGIYTAKAISPIPVQGIGSVPFRFDMAVASAVEWIQTRSSTLVTEITQEQRELVRQTIASRTSEGVNPKTTALDIVGRVDAITKKRTGGILGLTLQQSEWIDNASGEIDNLEPNYLSRKLRDKRFDRSFIKAMDSGTAVPAKIKRSMIENMRNKALRYRGQTIGRNEAINALRAGQHNGLVQAIDKGDLRASDITKEWDATNDTRTRPDHLQLEGKKEPFDGLFVTSKGSRLDYPGDTTHGALPSDVIQCRCVMLYNIDYLSKAMRGFS